MRNIFQDIHFDEDGDAEITQLVANDFFVAPSDSPNEAQYLWQKFIFTLREGGQITLVEDQTGEILHVADSFLDFYQYCHSIKISPTHSLTTCKSCGRENVEFLGVCEGCWRKL